MANVLIISQELASHLRVWIASEGHDVVEDDSGELMEEVVHSSPDLILVPDDSESPGAADLLPAVRRASDAAIVVVGSGDAVKMANTLIQGADAYLQHPVGRDQLRSRIGSLLRRRAAVQQTEGFTERHTLTSEPVA